jgi:putative addiction module component (TIGR02574 family)
MKVYPQITQMNADKMTAMDTVPNLDAEVEELWSIEAERRWQEIESGTAKTIPWEEVRARLFADCEPPPA